MWLSEQVVTKEVGEEVGQEKTTDQCHGAPYHQADRGLRGEVRRPYFLHIEKEAADDPGEEADRDEGPDLFPSSTQEAQDDSS